MQRDSPLTPAASWAPGGRPPLHHAGTGGGGDDDLRPSRSGTFARLTRSVSKLGSKRQQAGAAAVAGLRHVSSTEALASAVGGGGGAAARGGGAAGRGGGGLAELAGPSTATRLKLFEEGRFDLQRDLGGLSEKGVERLRAELAALEGEAASQLKSAVHEHYADFVRATPGILQLEGEVQQLRNLLHSMGDVVEGLREVLAAVAQTQRQAGAAAPAGTQAQQAQQARADAEAAWRQSGDGARWLECLDDADVAVAERRVADALVLLRHLEQQLQRLQAAADAGDPAQQAQLDGLQAEVEARRQRLIRTAEQQVLQPIATSADIQAGSDLLARMAGRAYAHAVVLEAHAAKLRRAQAGLLKPANSGGADADGSDYAAALGQKLALGLAAAADDVAAVFGRSDGEQGAGTAGSAGGGGRGELAAAFLAWALHQTERACHLLRKNALQAFAAQAGLTACVRCVFAFGAHAAALEASHGLQLVPAVLRETWPQLEAVLAKRVRRLGEALRRATAAEVDALAAGEAAPPQNLASWEALAAAFPSADYLLDELEGIAVEARRLACPRLGAAVRAAAADLFRLYTASLAGALSRASRAPGAGEDAKERLLAGAEAACELAAFLLDRFMAEALAPLADVCGDMVDERALSDQLARMGDALGLAPVLLTPGGTVAPGAEGSGVPAMAAAAAAAAEASQEGGEQEAAEPAEEEEEEAVRETDDGEDALAAAAAAEQG